MDSVIDIAHLTTRFGPVVVHDDIDLNIQQGELLAIVGGSGAGKTTLLRAILGLHKEVRGSIKVLGEQLVGASPKVIHAIRQHWGVMFQYGALFSSLSVLENVCFPLAEFTNLPKSVQYDIAMLKISMARFPIEAVHRFPSELSGGMLKRAALARAMVMDPQILFLDEPTAGLDPQSASALDELVLDLQSSLNLTIVMVTHDLDTLWRTANRVAFLGEQKVLAVDTMQALYQSEQPIIKSYFSNPRAQRVEVTQ